MPGETTVRINFGRPFPIFPLDVVPLFPRGVLQLQIADRRYLQLVTDALDASGQIAIAVYARSKRGNMIDVASVRPAVCVGQIIEHHRFPDGRYNLAIHGVCRARIVRELEPDEGGGGVLYRRAELEPVDEPSADEVPMTGVRDELVRMLDEGPLTNLRDASLIAKHIKDPEIPSTAIIELLSLAFISDSETRYRLLEEGDPSRRGTIVLAELGKLQRLLRLAEPQRTSDAPKGCSWN